MPSVVAEVSLNFPVVAMAAVTVGVMVVGGNVNGTDAGAFTSTCIFGPESKAACHDLKARTGGRRGRYKGIKGWRETYSNISMLADSLSYDVF